ncbi:septum formation initiator family protein [Paracoccus litorisediminis]|uniref:FtsB family cell division protein n=1 Tax=Paracoccus litorisediminis TaxID=2006130 RepID=UPI0037305ACC
MKKFNVITNAFSKMAFTLLSTALCLYFAHAALLGPSGITRRAEVLEENAKAKAHRDERAAELAKQENLVRRLSSESLDADLADERIRDVLGYMRSDEVEFRMPD